MTSKKPYPTLSEAPRRPGISSRGSAMVEEILAAALHVLVEEGASAFTFHRIALECGIQRGNVSRHFPRKEMLIQVLLDDILTLSEEDAERDLRNTGVSADHALAAIIRGNLESIETKTTSRLFIELWAMANHSEFVAERVERVYRHIHFLIASFVTELNPALSPADVEAVSLYIVASMEGMTALAGYGKPWQAIMPQMKNIAVKNLVYLAKTIVPEDIQGLTLEHGSAVSEWDRAHSSYGR